MSQFSKIMDRVYFLRNGCSDSDSGTVTTDHSSSSYGISVIVMDDGTPIGPADVEGGFVQAFGAQAEALKKAGFRVVENLGEQFCGPAPAGAGGWSKSRGWC